MSQFSNIMHHRSFSFSLYLDDNSALPEQFQQDIFHDHFVAQRLLHGISMYYRRVMMRAAARRAALFIIARYGEGDFGVFPRDIIKLIAHEVWDTRADWKWMDASEQ